MKYLVAIAIAMVWTPVAYAATKAVMWVLPTQNTDGSALPASQITRSTVVWGSSASTLTGSKAVTGAATSTTIDLPPGTHFIGVKVTANGNDSAVSALIQSVVPFPTPNPPTGVTVTDPTAFEIRPNSTGALVASRVGIIPVGTICSERQQTVGAVTYSLVPREMVDLVNWPNDTKIKDVWAKCG